MAASKKTVDDMFEVIIRHIDQQTLDEILFDLGKVEGNSSFIETIKRLQKTNARFKEQQQ